jgi:hypothetical protein
VRAYADFMLPNWKLLPVSDSPEYDPACPHCRVPGYVHRHWVAEEPEAEAPGAKQPGPVMRLMMLIWGDG